MTNSDTGHYRVLGFRYRKGDYEPRLTLPKGLVASLGWTARTSCRGSRTVTHGPGLAVPLVGDAIMLREFAGLPPPNYQGAGRKPKERVRGRPSTKDF